MSTRDASTETVKPSKQCRTTDIKEYLILTEYNRKTVLPQVAKSTNSWILICPDFYKCGPEDRYTPSTKLLKTNGRTIQEMQAQNSIQSLTKFEDDIVEQMDQAAGVTLQSLQKDGITNENVILQELRLTLIGDLIRVREERKANLEGTAVFLCDITSLEACVPPDALD